MTSIRLPELQEKLLEEVAAIENKSKSDVIKTALSEYMKKYEQAYSPYELGKNSFGKYGSSKGSLSTQYKTILRGKLDAKHTH